MIKDIGIRGEKLEIRTAGEYLPRDKNAVAIVGSRKMSKAGSKLTYDYAFFLAQRGITIISGLALGIDSVAHSAALDAGGRTIAVVAHGLDIVYPKENADLANRIIKNGCLVTKFKNGTLPLKENFLARNQLIAGLSKAVIVIEGERRSGSTSTANHAANLGIEVFAIAGSPATDFLIENGANVATKPENVLEYIRSI